MVKGRWIICFILAASSAAAQTSTEGDGPTANAEVQSEAPAVPDDQAVDADTAPTEAPSNTAPEPESEPEENAESAAVQTALDAALSSLAALETQVDAEMAAMRQEFDALSAALEAANAQNQELLAATLATAQQLGPLNATVAGLKSDLASLGLQLDGLAPPSQDGSTQTGAAVAAQVDERLSLLEQQVAALSATAPDVDVAPVTEPDPPQSATATTQEPFTLARDADDNPLLRHVDQIDTAQNELAKATECQAAGAWVTPRTDMGDNASFFVMDSGEVKSCRRIGEIWFALKAEPETLGFIVTRN